MGTKAPPERLRDALSGRGLADILDLLAEQVEIRIGTSYATVDRVRLASVTADGERRGVRVVADGDVLVATYHWHAGDDDRLVCMVCYFEDGRISRVEEHTTALVPA